MGNETQSTYCRICGLDQEEFPWGEDGRSPSFAICDCCGVEFGYEDCLLESVEKYRQRWLAKGAPWFRKKEKPENWSLEDQLKNIPEKFR